jgi:hypothetical protein
MRMHPEFILDQYFDFSVGRGERETLTYQHKTVPETPKRSK